MDNERESCSDCNPTRAISEVRLCSRRVCRLLKLSSQPRRKYPPGARRIHGLRVESGRRRARVDGRRCRFNGGAIAAPNGSRVALLEHFRLSIHLETATVPRTTVSARVHRYFLARPTTANFTRVLQIRVTLAYRAGLSFANTSSSACADF